jgi:hypothetical protein
VVLRIAAVVRFVAAAEFPEGVVDRAEAGEVARDQQRADDAGQPPPEGVDERGQQGATENQHTDDQIVKRGVVAHGVLLAWTVT